MQTMPKAGVLATRSASQRVVCAWCWKVITDGPAEGLVSHGICAACSERMMQDARNRIHREELEAERARLHPLDPRD